MTMHIVGPWLSTTGKKKGKVKFKSADEARRARELAADWEKLVKKHGTSNKIIKTEKLSYKLTTPAGRTTTTNIPSRNTGDGIGSSKQIPKYTGTKILGIGTMHKSNAVPIFSDDEAKSISSMRR
jgi:hypothetical protein